MTDTDVSAEFESEADAGSGPEAEVKRWLTELQLAEAEEKEWREDVKEAEKVFEGDTGGQTVKTENQTIGTRFNIYHANIQTIIPALYNSTPIPDIRRRHGDKDPTAKQSADVLERIIRHEIDNYDFDGVMNAGVQDMAVSGRGVVRVTYNEGLGPLLGQDGKPSIDPTTGKPPIDPETGEDQQDTTYQSVGCRYVPWATFRHGPARCFEDIPWVAFAGYYTKKALQELSPKHAAKVALDMRLGDDKEGAKDDEPNKDIFKRALVWEIWEKSSGKVIFIAPGFKDAPLRKTDDPLGLEQFFPVPKPMQGAQRSGSLVPICEHKLVKALLDELDTLTGRLTKLIQSVRVRAITAADVSADVKSWAEAIDNEIIEASNLGALLDKGGLDKMMMFWPLDPIINAIKVLYEQREMVKQSIYEATGIADILRGQSDPNETLGAQEIKQQWGSLRIQKRQQEVQRFIRDLFRLKAEIIANRYTPQNLILASGLQDDQGFMQAAPQVVQLLRQDVLRSYRIDIETDSTIRGDLTRNQQAMAEFVQGTGTYLQAIAPVIEMAPMLMEPLVVIYSAFARNFKLGKEVDTVLDGLPDLIKQGQQDKPPSPEEQKAQMEMEKMKAEMQMDQQKLQAEMQANQQKMQMELQSIMAKLGMEKEAHAADLQFKQQEHSMDLQAKQQDQAFQHHAQVQDQQFQQKSQAIDLHAKAVGARQDMHFKQESGEQQLALAKQKAAQAAKQKPATRQ